MSDLKRQAIELLRILPELRPCDRVELLEIGRWLAEVKFCGGPYDGVPLPIEWKDEFCCHAPDKHVFDCGAVYVLSPGGRYEFSGGAQ